jgi:hypothetical protein
MNARGKPLTAFETFKARFEELLVNLFPTEKRKCGDANVSIASFFERRIDTAWTDLFWAYKSPHANTFDDLVMNLLLALARVSLNPESPGFNRDTTILRDKQISGTFSLFHERGWLTQEFSNNIIEVLEAWGRGSGKLTPVLPNQRYFDEEAFFLKAIRDPGGLDYTELVQFAAFVIYLRHHQGKVQPTSMNDWMRVAHNLANNSEIERPEEFGRSLAGLHKLVPYSNDILKHLAEDDVGQIGFSREQVREEALKAKLLRSDSGWRGRIDRAEEHGYFAGQIEFILDFCGVLAQDGMPENWDKVVHVKLHTDFDTYLTKAQKTFTSSGLENTAGTHLWKRALLTTGDYLLLSGSNSSFATDPAKNWNSWKRFLRSSTRGTRRFLKDLWDQIDADIDIKPQLEHIIATATDVEPWRAEIIRHPEVISYCGQQEVRRVVAESEIYLLKRKQMSGYHAELFSYALYLDLTKGGTSTLKLAPLTVQRYESVYMSELEPHVVLTFNRSNRTVTFLIESVQGQFRICVRVTELENLPEVEGILYAHASFVKLDENLMRLVPRTEIYNLLKKVSECLAQLPPLSS